MAAMSRQPLREKNRQTARDIVLDAAERLLQNGGTADFSMRALAAEAGVGFTTPFNHFGSKTAIMQALSSRLIERMTMRFHDETPGGDALDRVLAMGRIGVALLLEKPDVNRAVVGSLGVASPTPGAVRRNSRELWSLALGDFTGVAAEMGLLARAVLPEQLAFGFRGCVSFWVAGELQDDDLGTAFLAGACTILLGFVEPERRTRLIGQIERLHGH